MRSWARGGVIVAWIAASGCDSPSDDVARVAEAYTELVRSLGERDADSVDVDSGSLRAVPERIALEAIEARAVSLANRLEGSSTQRALRLRAELAAVAERSRALMGVEAGFDHRLALSYGMEPPARLEAADAAPWLGRLDRALAGDGPLRDRLAAFESRYAVAPGTLELVAASALHACREASDLRDRLPVDESVVLGFVRGKSWASHHRYLGEFRSLVELNEDAAWTVPGVIDAVCHESYAGHHVLVVLADDRLVRAKALAEHRVLLLHGPRGALLERLANGGAAFARRELRRTALEAAVYRTAGLSPDLAHERVEVDDALAGLRPFLVEGARRYADGELDRVGTVLWLERAALLPDAWTFLRFVDRYGAYVAAYASGDTIASWEELETLWLQPMASEE